MSSGFLVLVNAQAGSSERAHVEDATDRFARAGAVEVVETSSAAELERALRQTTGRHVVVAGGDGSVHLTVAHLRDLDLLGSTTVGLLPLGTGNDLARALGIPLDPRDAADVIVGGATRTIDILADDSGGIAVNAAHAGLGARAALHSASWKDPLGPLAYPLGALIAAAQEDGWRLSVSVDDERLEIAVPVLMIGVANGPTIGGGTPLCPVARPDDGFLDVVVVTATERMARVGFGTDLRAGDHLERDDVQHVRCRSVRVEGDAVRYNADGEISDPVRGRSYRVEDAALTVSVPA